MKSRARPSRSSSGVDVRVEHDDAGVAVEAGRVEALRGLEAELVLARLDAVAGDLDRAAVDALPLAGLGRGEHVLHRAAERACRRCAD